METCYTCSDEGPISGKDISIFSEGEIPLWSKKQGNYSPYPRMVTCDEKYNVKERETMVTESPKVSEKQIRLEVDFGEENREAWIYYWAANPSEDTLSIQPPESAYGKDENHGLQKTDKEGKVKIIINCPQIYREFNPDTEEERTYCRHIHYLVEQKEEGIWSEIITRRVICCITLDALQIALKKKDSVVINGLPRDSYQKYEIKDTVNLPYNEFEGLSHIKKTRKALEFLEKNIEKFQVVKEKVDGKDIDIKDVPIIVYCANKKCDASHKLINYLYECGIHNVVEWKEGYEGYEEEEEEEEEEGEEKSVTLFDDAKSIDEGASETTDEDTGESTEDASLLKRTVSVKNVYIFEDVKYLVDEETNEVYKFDEDNIPVGKGVLKKGKLISIEWNTEDLKEEHKKERRELILSDDSDSEESEHQKVKEESEHQKVKEEESEIKEAEQKGKQEKYYRYKKTELETKEKQELIQIVIDMQKRGRESYNFDEVIDALKNDEEGLDKLRKIIIDCEGKPKDKKKKSDYPYSKPGKKAREKELKELSFEELEEIVIKLNLREKEEYKYGWLKDDPSKETKKGTRENKEFLINLILNCRGRPNTKRGRKSLKKMGGWGFTY